MPARETATEAIESTATREMATEATTIEVLFVVCTRTRSPRQLIKTTGRKDFGEMHTLERLKRHLAKPDELLGAQSFRNVYICIGLSLCFW